MAGIRIRRTAAMQTKLSGLPQEALLRRKTLALRSKWNWGSINASPNAPSPAAPFHL
jgi:hypothetical protein